MKLSIIMPVYNEEKTLRDIIERVRKVDLDKELIIVDDGSGDRTKEILTKIKDDNTILLSHRHNQGKGRAIRTALEYVRGEVVTIQDADLEYDPADYAKLMEPIKKGYTQVVYGSRFLEVKNVSFNVHYLINWFLTSLVNFLYKSSLTDMETCYKVFKTEIIKSLSLKSNGFEIEPELTIKTLKKGYAICEVPISYKSRTYHEGKKINWLDALKTLGVIFKYKIVKCI